MKEPQNVVEQMLIEEKRQKVASIIRTARIKKGWTQQELADRIRCKVQTINKIENVRFSPNADILYILLDCLDLTLKIGNEKI
ncbi:helix-turn-helix transcriptional regulator [Flavobacterium psychrophilum]|uniref:Transcriptional regulator n=6 Tax=root TaxID=1 RepID=A0A1B0WM89_9CAUD|nr:helix-turn-helix transcriptional regulator [Flavobacterium psychrophilum]YP_008320439.1 helix-turn-helix transcriptional regulator [Flavobacterium phage 6H]YP_009321841.1 helix-turn-helix transcriptional regulator [Flavobacterium phage 1H]YP_009322898.1 helix-turn-helix transcriptional regulator [Flavobacterium phage 2A]YP_009592333.1 helix-turn-helix transcriptional regulator [Flavobacterium phage 23T]QCW20058.1 XRE family transcriptional regulator [Flavobacterium phage FPSV-D15]QCW20213.